MLTVEYLQRLQIKKKSVQNYRNVYMLCLILNAKKKKILVMLKKERPNSTAIISMIYLCVMP